MFDQTLVQQDQIVRQVGAGDGIAEKFGRRCSACRGHAGQENRMLWVERDQTSDQGLCRARLANRDGMNPDAILACRRALDDVVEGYLYEEDQESQIVSTTGSSMSSVALGIGTTTPLD